MILPIVVRDAHEERVYDSGDLPLVVGGGPGAHVAADGGEGGEALALLGVADEQVFVQPGTDVPVSVNGRRIETSRWLRNGDWIRVGSVRIHCEFGPERLDFRVQRSAATDADAADADDPAHLAPEEIEPIAYTAAARGRSAWRRRIPIVPLLLVAFFLRSDCSAGSSSPPGRSA